MGMNMSPSMVGFDPESIPHVHYDNGTVVWDLTGLDLSEVPQEILDEVEAWEAYLNETVVNVYNTNNDSVVDPNNNLDDTIFDIPFFNTNNDSDNIVDIITSNNFTNISISTPTIANDTFYFDVTTNSTNSSDEVDIPARMLQSTTNNYRMY